MTTLGVIQPNFLPWRGYFDLVSECDEFVFLDTVQYTKNDWRNRNIILLNGRPCWLTVPVHGSIHEAIGEVKVDYAKHWRRKHIGTLEQAYGWTAHGGDLIDWLSGHYSKRPELLTDLTIPTTVELARMLGITTRFHRASAFDLPADREERLIALCRIFTADRYLSGPAAAVYLTREKWQEAGVELVLKQYPEFPEYPQRSDEFHPNVSVLDLIAVTGSAAAEYVRSSYSRSGAFLAGEPR